MTQRATEGTATAAGSAGNIYQPTLMRIAAITDEAPDVRTFRLEFRDEAYRTRFYNAYRVGQFAIYGVPGAGESAFCVASPPTRKDYVECTFRKSGRVTAALADREAGQSITFRGPYGTAFPIEDWRGRDLVFVAGGIGLPPLRSVIWNILDRRAEFGNVTIVYGARTVADLVYKRELTEWAGRGDVRLVTTVDPGGQTPEWTGKVGFVPTVLKEAAPSAKNAVAVVCGPPIMIKLSLPALEGLGFTPDTTYSTLENRMKCGVGKCGRCNVGPMYVCKDGPVFTVAQLRALPQGDM